YTQWAEVLSALKSHYPDFNSITIQEGSATVSTARYGNTRGSDRYSFDPATGEITEVQLYKDLPKSGKIRGWIYSVHVGSWGGMTTRILTCLVSLLGTIFAITGYYFWIKKQFRKLR
ncbi:PepSY domain-containing protein, partial [Parabacteroides sp.]